MGSSALHLNPLIIIIIGVGFFFFLPFSWCPASDFPGLLLPDGTGGFCSENYQGSPWRCFAFALYPAAAARAALNSAFQMHERDSQAL